MSAIFVVCLKLYENANEDVSYHIIVKSVNQCDVIKKKVFSYLKASVDGLVIWEFIWFDIDLNPVEVEI